MHCTSFDLSLKHILKCSPPKSETQNYQGVVLCLGKWDFSGYLYWEMQLHDICLEETSGEMIPLTPKEGT